MVRCLHVVLCLNVLQKTQCVSGKSVICLVGQLDQAATWLLENVENMVTHGQSSGALTSSGLSTSLSGVEVKAESICICFIDDCLDCDIPLAELTFSSMNTKRQHFSILHSFNTATDIPFFVLIKVQERFVFAGLHVLQRIGSNQEGNTSFTLCGDFYNRELSGRATVHRAPYTHDTSYIYICKKPPIRPSPRFIGKSKSTVYMDTK